MHARPAGIPNSAADQPRWRPVPRPARVEALLPPRVNVFAASPPGLGGPAALRDAVRETRRLPREVSVRRRAAPRQAVAALRGERFRICATGVGDVPKRWLVELAGRCGTRRPMRPGWGTSAGTTSCSSPNMPSRSRRRRGPVRAQFGPRRRSTRSGGAPRLWDPGGTVSGFVDGRRRGRPAAALHDRPVRQNNVESPLPDANIRPCAVTSQTRGCHRAGMYAPVAAPNRCCPRS